MALGDDRNQRPLQPIGKGGEGLDLQQEIQELIGREQKLEKEAGQENKPLDQAAFTQISKDLPRLIQRVLQKIEASQVYQTFKLPGRDYIVHDRREAKGSSKEKSEGQKIADESKTSLEALLLQRGKLTPAKEKDYENFFADPAKKGLLPEQRGVEERLQKLFTRFEKALLGRFEEGESIARLAEEGRFSFLKKTAGQWRDFFSHFMKRTVKRHVPLDQVGEWTFRGLVRKDSKATVISDLALTNGKLEKFVRFRLSQAAQNLAERLAMLEPGVRLSKEELKEHSAEELEYLAIKNSEPDAAWALGPTKGKFLGTAQAEEKVASDLGLTLSAQAKERERVLRDLGKRKKGAGGFGLGEEEELPQDAGSVFVPWWSRPFQKRTGPVRWFVIAIYFVIVAAIALGILSLFKLL